jgi:hypothetical protein
MHLYLINIFLYFQNRSQKYFSPRFLLPSLK